MRKLLCHIGAETRSLLSNFNYVRVEALRYVLRCLCHVPAAVLLYPSSTFLPTFLPTLPALLQSQSSSLVSQLGFIFAVIKEFNKAITASINI